MLTQSEVMALRRDFPALQQRHPVNGKPPIYLDNSCVTLKPLSVANAVWDYTARFSGCGGHRSDHWFSAVTEERVMASRRALAELLGVPMTRTGTGEETYPVIFTRNTSESLNLLSRSLGLLEGESVLVSNKEHNSNLCPWQELERHGTGVRYTHFNKDNTFDLDGCADILRTDRSIKLVSLHHSSNLDGVCTPVAEIVALIRRIEAEQQRTIFICLDGAQAAPHIPLNLGRPEASGFLDVDFYAGSVHKMLGPSGVGFLYAKPECLDYMRPFLVGGSTIFETSIHHKPIYAEWPERFEAGLQNYAGIHGAGSAADYLQPLMPHIKPYEQHLNSIMTEVLMPLHVAGRVRILGPLDSAARGGVCTIILPYFSDDPQVRRLHAVLLDHNVMYRAGQFCVDSWFSSQSANLPERYTPIRFSFYFYNTEEEAELTARLIRKILS
ncbi:MAG: aminotransferase class V-fold PLP-dependent enzyme [Aquisalimonadaceae bacterium]